VEAGLFDGARPRCFRFEAGQATPIHSRGFSRDHARESAVSAANPTL
jgi:hypothetical protein